MIAYKNGAPVRLSDVGKVIEGAENTKLGAWMGISGKGVTPAVVLDVQRQPGANVIAVVDAIKAQLPQLQAAMPGAIDVAILTDRTVTIRASVGDVEFELTLAVALVVMVIFLFLRNVRATIIPSLSVPVSLIGTFGAMYLLGFSINNLSLMALTIATGFVVDDAIVMIENVSRYLEEGETPLRGGAQRRRQIGFTIISLTISWTPMPSTTCESSSSGPVSLHSRDGLTKLRAAGVLKNALSRKAGLTASYPAGSSDSSSLLPVWLNCST